MPDSPRNRCPQLASVLMPTLTEAKGELFKVFSRRFREGDNQSRKLAVRHRQTDAAVPPRFQLCWNETGRL